jgi:hypothetical protein
MTQQLGRLALQIRGLFLILNVVTQEVLRVAASIGSQSENSHGAAADGDDCKDQQNCTYRADRAEFAEPSAAVMELAHQGGALTRIERRLLNTDWQWATQARLKITRVHIYQATTSNVEIERTGNGQIVVCANSVYDEITIDNTGGSELTPPDHTEPRVKLVSFQSDRSSCKGTDFDMATGYWSTEPSTGLKLMGAMGLSSPGGGLKLNQGAHERILRSGTAEPLVFMHGGEYKICYTPDGTWGGGDNTENTVLQGLYILGIKSACDHPQGYVDGCIKNETWHCYYGYRGEANQNCKYNFRNHDNHPNGITDESGRPGWDIFVGDDTPLPSMISWSAAFGDDTLDANGKATATSPRECSVSTPDSANFGGLNPPNKLAVSYSVIAVMPPIKKTAMDAFTTLACYCPGYNVATGKPCTPGEAASCCDDTEEYIQDVGTVYWWTMRICDAGPHPDEYLRCTSPYMRVIPQQKFVIRIQCPPGGCEHTDNNRIKLLLPPEKAGWTDDDDLPNWHPNQRCKTQDETELAIWPSRSDSVAVSGGTRQDYKLWKDKQVKLAHSLGKVFQICFNNNAAAYPQDWMRIGTVMTTSAFAFASKVDASSSYRHLKFVDYPGSITLYGGTKSTEATSETSDYVVDPHEGNKFSGKALLNIISYDRDLMWGVAGAYTTLSSFYGFDTTMPPDYQDQMDQVCQRGEFKGPVVGNWDTTAVKDYIAEIPTSVDSYMSFSGPSKNRMLQIGTAGVIAICYCAMLSGVDVCSMNQYWLFAGLTTIRGPTGGQEWFFPTNQIFHLSVHGWGLTGCDNTVTTGDDCLASGRDRLRIVDTAATGSCTSNTNNPTSFSGYKLGCPSADGLCASAGPTADIQMRAVTSRSSNAHITEVTPGNVSTILKFANPLTGFLKENDMITIERSSIQIGSTYKSAAQATPQERFDIDKLSGEYTFKDQTELSADDRYMLAHQLSSYVVGGAIQDDMMSIPMAWSSGTAPNFSFASGMGHWKQRNKITSAAEIKASVAQSNLTVCWGMWEQGVTTYYKDAGTIHFIDPPLMKSVKVDLTAKMNGAVAPVVITIQTNDIPDYAQATGNTQLVLRFTSISAADGKLIPLTSADANPSPANSQPEKLPEPHVDPVNMKQSVCGRLFLELWAEHEDGFPVPRGCHYGPKLKDAGTGEKFVQEVFLVFGDYAGLRGGTTYQIVLNARARNIDLLGLPLLDLYAMCAEERGCQRPYHVFEKGVAESGSLTETPAQSNELGWGTDGFYIQRAEPSTGVLDLTTLNILQIRLTGIPLAPISAGNVIRIYLWPVTLWDIGPEDCAADCVPYHGSSAVCGAISSCKTEQVFAGTRRNVIRLKLPADMDEITDVVQHTVRITGLTLPEYGFFPTRLGAEVRLADGDTDSRPAYTTSSGYLMKQPSAGVTEGRIVLSDRTGFGPKPFAGDSSNILYLRLQFGATLHHNGVNYVQSATFPLTSEAAYFRITLPPDYTCTVSDEGHLPLDLPAFQWDYNGDGYKDNARGLLNSDAADGTWSGGQDIFNLLYRPKVTTTSTGSESCIYTLAAFNTIFAKQVFYVKVNVTNPPLAVKRELSSNNWTVMLFGKGVHQSVQEAYQLSSNTEKDPSGVPFITTAKEKEIHEKLWASNPSNPKEKLWASNAAVINKISDEVALQEPLIQPTNFEIGAYHDLRIFFYTGANIIKGGFVILDAPLLFDFGEVCLPRDLPSYYYDFIGDVNPQLHQLKNMRMCQGSRYPSEAGPTPLFYNRARVEVWSAISERKWYGMQIKVRNPNDYYMSQHRDWYITIEDPNEFPLESTYSSVPQTRAQVLDLQGFHYQSWGMYFKNCADEISISLSGMTPHAVSEEDVDFIFYGLSFAEDETETSLRITAPDGYVWNSDVGNLFALTTNGTSVSWPALPSRPIERPNVLEWADLKFAGGILYGFSMKIAIPKFTPVTSSNSFYIEFGYDRTTTDLTYRPNTREMAAVKDIGMVQAITAATVDYFSNLQGFKESTLEFSFRTMQKISSGGGIQIRGDHNTQGFNFTGPWSVVERSDKLSPDVKVTTALVNQLPVIVIEADVAPINPGFYVIDVPVKNPVQKVLNLGMWTVGSYANVGPVDTICSPVTCPVIDMAISAYGFAINPKIFQAMLYPTDAALADKTGRVDRPGGVTRPRNNIIFQWSPSYSPDQRAALVLRAPRGFVFDEECLQRVVVKSDEIFCQPGQKCPDDEWPTNQENLLEWPVAYEPDDCVGEGRIANIFIPYDNDGLQRRKSYLFRIGVTNPKHTPVWNYWSIEYNGETADPFEGFPIWTNTDMKILPSTQAKAPYGAEIERMVNPVRIIFRPYNTVRHKPPEQDDAVGGLIKLRAPAGFEFVSDDMGKCTIILEDPQFIFPASAFDCNVDTNKMTMRIENIGTADIQGGILYNLIVRVINPPDTRKISQMVQEWRMDTYSHRDMLPQSELDESRIEGYDVVNVLNRFEVTNVAGILEGNTLVTHVTVLMEFPDPLKDGADQIFIRSPPGYDMEGNPQVKTCKGFEWPQNEPIPLPKSGGGRPNCVCGQEMLRGVSVRQCTMSWDPIQEDKPQGAFPENTPLTFKIQAINPQTTPFETDNFWRVEHIREGKVYASSVARSWNLRPQLEEVDVVLNSDKKEAAGAMSDLEFKFIPVSDAETIKIVAKEPADFSFQQSSVQVPLNIDAKSELETIIINFVPIRAGSPVSLFIRDVRLGEVGGQTKFDIVTFAGKIPPTGEQDAIRVDERLDFTGGFRLPGKVEVVSRKLDSLYSINQALYPVKSFLDTFSPRVDERAKAEFEITMTRRTMAGSYLEVTCEGLTAYALEDEGFLVQAPSGAQIPATARLNGRHQIRAQMRPNMPATETAFVANTKYKIILFTIPIAGTQNAWRFETTDDDPLYPSNTNDADIGSFSPVEAMTFKVEVPRAPPGALANVSLKIEESDVVIRQLMIIAPRNFVFPSDGCGDMCQPSTMFEDTEQMTAQIASPTGEPLTNLKSTRIKVQTPEMTPSSSKWFIVGKTTGGMQTVAWGEADGFQIKQMSNTQGNEPMILYPGILGLKNAQITFKFSLDVGGGRSIAVTPPAGYLLTCSTEGALVPLSLPGKKPSCVDEPLELILSAPLEAAEYSFALAVDIPVEEPNPNTFNVIVKDVDGKTVDAVYNYYGRALRDDMNIHTPTLTFSSTTPGKQSIVYFGFTLGEAETKMRSLLLKFPNNFIHDVMRPTDVQNFNKDFRVAAGNTWMDVSSFTDRIIVKLDDTDPTLTVPPGEYEFRFPVMVPCCYQADMPKNNVWYLAICYDQFCTEPDDKSVLVTFPIAGFNLNDKPTASAIRGQTSAARRQWHLRLWQTPVLGLLIFAVCMCRIAW